MLFNIFHIDAHLPILYYTRRFAYLTRLLTMKLLITLLAEYALEYRRKSSGLL